MSKRNYYKRRFQIGGAVVFGMAFMVVMLVGFSTTGQSLDNADIIVTAAGADEPIEWISTVAVETKETEPTVTTVADKQYYNIPLSEELQDYIIETATEYGVPPELIIAVIQNESSYRATATGAAGEQGFMQIHPVNFEWLGEELGITDFYDPKQNILAGTYMLAEICEKYETTNEVLMCYNCGERGAKRLWEQGITETEYCRKIKATIESIKKA